VLDDFFSQFLGKLLPQGVFRPFTFLFAPICR